MIGSRSTSVWDTVELRDIRLVIALAEELSFSRAARCLGVTPSRASQMVSGLERKLGCELFHRTSRRVTITAAGRALLDAIAQPVTQLQAAMEAVQQTSRQGTGRVRLGLTSPTDSGPILHSIIETYEQFDESRHVELVQLPATTEVEALLAGDVDVIAVRLPLTHPAITIGPILSTEPRVLAVSRDHPLADRDHVTLEDVADYEVAPFEDIRTELLDSFLPRVAPSGRPIRRLPTATTTFTEIALLIARGRIVHPTVPAFALHAGHANIVYIPIRDMPESQTALAYKKRLPSPAARSFIDIAAELIPIGQP